MNRLDQRLVELGLAPSRSKAKALILGGEVEVETQKGWAVADDPSHPGPEKPNALRLRSQRELKFVSRGGLKLEAALTQLKINPSGYRALDIGQSTGGFTDCLLQAGARTVVGVDVGHGQLHPKLGSDSKVQSFAGVHVRELKTHPEFLKCAKEKFDLCVIDVSFISLEKTVPHLLPFIAGAQILALVKPQFELGKDALNRSGIVKDLEQLSELEVKIKARARDWGFSDVQYFACPVLGQKGAQEFFLFGRT